MSELERYATLRALYLRWDERHRRRAAFGLGGVLL